MPSLPRFRIELRPAGLAKDLEIQNKSVLSPMSGSITVSHDIAQCCLQPARPSVFSLELLFSLRQHESQQAFPCQVKIAQHSSFSDARFNLLSIVKSCINGKGVHVSA